MSDSYYETNEHWDLMARNPIVMGGRINTSSDTAREELQERMNKYQKQSDIRIQLGANAEKKVKIYKNDVVWYFIFNALNNRDNAPQYMSSINGLKFKNSKKDSSDDSKQFWNQRDLEKSIRFGGLAHQQMDTTKEVKLFDLYRDFSKTVQGPVPMLNHCHPGTEAIWEKYPDITTQQELYDNEEIIQELMEMGQASHQGETYETYIPEWDYERPGTLYNPSHADYVYMQGFTVPLGMRNTGRLFTRMRERRSVDDREFSMKRRMKINHGTISLLVSKLQLDNDGKIFLPGQNGRIQPHQLKNFKDGWALMSEFQNYTKKTSQIPRLLLYCLDPGNFGEDHLLYVMGSKEKNGNYRLFHTLEQL